jgi:hypothetical protein
MPDRGDIRHTLLLLVQGEDVVARRQRRPARRLEVVEQFDHGELEKKPTAPTPIRVTHRTKLPVGVAQHRQADRSDGNAGCQGR